MSEEPTWEDRSHALTHILTSPTTAPSLHSHLFLAAHVPCFVAWDYAPILCKDRTFPSPHLKWLLSRCLRRVLGWGPPQSSWRAKCPYQQPPPLVLAEGVEEARWGQEERRRAFRERLARKPLVNKVNPLIPIVVPNLLVLALLFWEPPLPKYFWN